MHTERLAVMVHAERPHQIAQIGSQHDGFQLMKSVGPPARYFQKRIDFGGRANQQALTDM